MGRFKLLVLLFLALMSSVCVATNRGEKERKSSVEVSAKLISRHLWRGRNTNDSPCFEPDITYNINSNWAISLWGAYSYKQDYREFDIYVTYRTKQLVVTLFDYYAPTENTKFFGDEYMNLGSSSQHIFDLKLDYRLKKLPITLTASTLVYGDDKDANDDQQFSTYFQVTYSLEKQRYVANFGIGGTPARGLYKENAGIVNYETEVIAPVKIIPKVKTNLTALGTYNPIKDKVFFRGGIQIIL